MQKPYSELTINELKALCLEMNIDLSAYDKRYKASYLAALGVEGYTPVIKKIKAKKVKVKPTKPANDQQTVNIEILRRLNEHVKLNAVGGFCPGLSKGEEWYPYINMASDYRLANPHNPLLKDYIEFIKAQETELRQNSRDWFSNRYTTISNEAPVEEFRNLGITNELHKLEGEIILGDSLNDDRFRQVKSAIKKAYRKLANVYHPDKRTGNVNKFREVTYAYETCIKYLDSIKEEEATKVVTF